METSVYIWFDYTKPSGSSSSKIAWCGTADIEKIKKAVNKITADDMLKCQKTNFFKHDVELSISIQNLKNSEVLYRRVV